MSRDSSAVVSATAAAATVCSNCCSDDRWILHNVRLRGIYRKLCTSCVLKLHPSSFCPTCFSLHDTSPSPSPPLQNHRTLVCFKCSSLSHAACVPPNAPKSPYLCPPCANPNFKFFEFKKPSKNSKMTEVDQRMDERAARVLLAAARISAGSMSKGAALAKAEAEKRVKEAAVARKRAREAIERVLGLAREREKVLRQRREREMMNGDDSGGGFKGMGVNVVANRAGLVSNGSGGAVVVGRERVVSPPPAPPPLPSVRQLGGQGASSMSKNEKVYNVGQLENQNGSNVQHGEMLNNGSSSGSGFGSSQNLQNNNHGGKDDMVLQ